MGAIAGSSRTELEEVSVRIPRAYQVEVALGDTGSSWAGHPDHVITEHVTWSPRLRGAGTADAPVVAGQDRSGPWGWSAGWGVIWGYSML